MKRLLLLACPAFAQSWIPSGPPAATVFDLARDPFEPLTLYAGTYFGGLYQSSDFGRNWFQVDTPFDSHTVFAVLPDPKVRGRIFVATFQGGVFRTDDAGRTWRRRSDGLGTRIVLSLALDPFDDDHLLAATSEGVFASLDGGGAWRATESPTGVGSRAILFHPSRRGQAYQGGSRGVLASTDSGLTWAPLGTGIAAGQVEDLAWSESTSSLYAATPTRLFRLADRAESWTEVTDDLPSTLVIQTVAVRNSPGQAGRIYLATNSGVWVRSEDASGWRPDLLEATRLVRFFDGTTMLADLYGFGVRVLDAGGLGYEVRLSGFQNSFAGALGASRIGGVDVVLAGLDDGVTITRGDGSWIRPTTFREGVFSLLTRANGDLLAGTERAGVWKSGDGGITWSAMANGIAPPNIGGIALAADGQVAFAATAAGPYVSRDGGLGWSFYQTLGISYSVAIDLVNPQRVLVGGGAGTVLVSDDGGVSFTPLGRGLPNDSITWIKVIPFQETYLVTSQGALFVLDQPTREWRKLWDRPSARAFQLDSDPTEPQVLYLATLDGLYRSTDAGANWTKMGGINGPALSVSLDLFAPGTIYVGGNNRVLVSENKGDTWRELGTGLGSGPVTSLAKAGSTVFAAVFDSGVFRLDGESWRRVESIPSAGLNVVASALTEPRAVMVGTALDGLFRSTDGGTTWSQAERGLSLFIRGLAADGTTLYAGALAGGMFRSDDGGARWRNVGLRDRNIFVVQPDPANPSTVYAGTSLGVSRSTDRGANWAQITQRTASIRSIAVDPRDRNVVYVGGPAGRIDRSADGGRSWTIVNQGIPSSPVVALAVDSVDGSVYAAVERLGVYRSRNRGSDWERVSEIGDIVVLVASPRAGVLYAGSATEGVYQVDEQGRWNSFAGNLPNREVSALAIDFASPAVLLAATRSGVFRTTDGRTWSAAGRETGDTVSDLAADPSRPGRIYAATPRGLFATQDGGGRWSPVAGLPARGFVAVAVDPRGQGVAAAAADGGVWASTDGSAWRVSAEGVALGERGLVFGPSARDVFGGSVGQGIIRTTDGGASWEVNAPEATSEVACLALVVNPRNPQVIYAGAVGSGVIKTSNGGRTWQVANSGLAGRQVLSMVIDPDDPEVVYVGTVEGGVYITRNGAGTWSPLGDGIARRTVTSLLLDTRSGRNLWAGTEGGGVYRFRQPR